MSDIRTTERVFTSILPKQVEHLFKPPDSIDQKPTSPARTQSGLSAATPTTAAENETLANTYKSPLDLLIQDQEKVFAVCPL